MLDSAALSVYAATLLVAVALPGPGVAALVVQVLGKGARRSLAFAAGMTLGDAVWLSLAVGGLAVLAQSFHAVFLAIRYAGAAYLVYLAWKLWTTPPAALGVEAKGQGQRPWRSFFGGLSMSLGNPKVMMFYTALLPNLLDLGRISLSSYAELVTATEIVVAAVLGLYVVLAARARTLFTSPRAMRVLNRGCSTAMAGAAVAVVAR
ncbi:LysE family translocator [Labrys monachus]|uniref:Threonine/homoserine/homoserine lactone efflux protein n=1 Tax=Labrys monachus TaxID=217067 RepID=A0ABU0FN28_9HYPH|nr:LysE family translocator [Labrys monachus]MDQ0396026.1 threonine/homoserine/homoserine lactone efflux protein [Labrys monachus]